MFVSKMIISDDFEGVKIELLEQFHPNSLRFIPKEVANEFLMEDAKDVQRESYIAESSQKIIVLMAYSFRIEAQNFLLKLLEEPPKNIQFLIVVPSKNLLLPTVRSRLICEKRSKIGTQNALNLELDKMNFKNLFEFLRENENLDKVQLMERIVLIAQQSLRSKDFKFDELEVFYQGYELAKLNSKSSLILTTFLLNYHSK